MAGSSLIVIHCDPPGQAAQVVEDVMQRWPENQRPRVLRYTLAAAAENPKAFAHAGLAWLALDPGHPPGISALLDLLQEHAVPVLLSHVDETKPPGSPHLDGVVTAGLHTHPDTLLVMLRTLWSQAAVFDQLQTDLHVLRLHQGGLCDQIDKMDEELRLAAQLQREFLPHSLPSLPNLALQVLFRPAGYVSGDIYDVIRIDEDHVGLFIADAVGHGVPAALITMYIKRCLHTKRIDAALPRGYAVIWPDEAMAILNRDMLEQQQAGKMRFVTACYAVLNVKTLELSYARAGHPYPVVLRQGGTMEFLESDGAMLGIFEEEVFELKRVQLQPGDRFLLYSDGFEFVDPKKRAAEGERDVNLVYTDELRLLASGSLTEAMQQLAERLDHASGSLNQQDDLTVLAAEIIGKAARSAPRTEVRAAPAEAPVEPVPVALAVG